MEYRIGGANAAHERGAAGYSGYLIMIPYKADIYCVVAVRILPTRPSMGMDRAILREFFAELAGTFAIVFLGCGSVTSGNTLMSVAFVFGMVVYVAIECVGDVSGAHFNPAVTFTLCLVAGFPPIKVPVFFAAQFAGAFLGGGVLKAMTPGGTYNSGIGIPDNLSVGQAFMWEFFGTLAIILTVLLVAVRPGQHVMHPGWPIGLTCASPCRNPNHSLAPPQPTALCPAFAHVLLFPPRALSVFFMIAVHGPYTGAGINPARSIGSVVFQSGFLDTKAGKNIWVYILGPFLASLVGPVVAWLLYDSKDSGMTLKSLQAPLKEKYSMHRQPTMSAAQMSAARVAPSTTSS